MELNIICTKKYTTKNDTAAKSRIGKNISFVALKIFIPNQANKTGKYNGNRYKTISAKSLPTLSFPFLYDL